jgi:5'-nucleotidase
MRVLITNDDGIDSPGLHALAAVAVEAGHDVVVAAPSWDSSGASASLTAVEDDGRLCLERRSLESLGVAEAFAVEAAPAFIVRAAVTGVFGPAPELVLSGINAGPNTGHAILHSGTVGAAFTAATFCIPAMAVSLVVRSEPRWDAAASVAATALPWVERLEPPTVLNVNVPDVAAAELVPMQRAVLAPFGAVQTTVTERGQGYVKLGFSEIAADPDDDSDAGLLARGIPCFTEIRALQEVGGHPAAKGGPVVVETHEPARA